MVMAIMDPLAAAPPARVLVMSGGAGVHACDGVCAFDCALGVCGCVHAHGCMVMCMWLRLRVRLRV